MNHNKATSKSMISPVNPEYPNKDIRITSKIICNIVIFFIYQDLIPFLSFMNLFILS